MPRQKNRRGGGKRQSKKRSKKREKWYYDACTLEHQDTFAEIINKRPPKESVVSHLSLGEAIANQYLKGEEALSSFVDLIQRLKKVDYLTVVEHDPARTVFGKVTDEFPRLSLSDAVHLATAIKCKCCVFKTSDQDFHGKRADIKKFVEENFDVESFGILEVKRRS